MIKAILFDLSGVLYEDEQALPGAVDIVTRLQADAIPVRFLTNTSRSTSATILERLEEMGFTVSEQQVFTAPKALKQICINKHYRPYCLIHKSLAPEFADLEQSDPNAVVVADAAERFDYDHLNRAFSILMQGAPLLAVGLNRFFKSQGDLQLDAGPFIKALEYAAGVEAQIVGKPAVAFYQAALDSLEMKADKVLMIGDDVESDVGGALAAGLHACLVQTGKYQVGDEHQYDKAHHAANVSEAVKRFFYQQA